MWLCLQMTLGFSQCVCKWPRWCVWKWPSASGLKTVSLPVKSDFFFSVFANDPKMCLKMTPLPVQTDQRLLLLVADSEYQLQMPCPRMCSTLVDRVVKTADHYRRFWTSRLKGCNRIHQCHGSRRKGYPTEAPEHDMLHVSCQSMKPGFTAVSKLRNQLNGKTFQFEGTWKTHSSCMLQHPIPLEFWKDHERGSVAALRVHKSWMHHWLTLNPGKQKTPKCCHGLTTDCPSMHKSMQNENEMIQMIVKHVTQVAWMHHCCVSSKRRACFFL